MPRLIPRFRALAVLSAVALMLFGCGAAPAVQSPPTSTLKPAPTATPLLPVQAGVIDACFGQGSSTSMTGVRVGDLVLTTPVLGFLAYPSVMLPDGTSTTHPFKLQASGPQDYPLDFATSPITNPDLGGQGSGFLFGVCNVSAGTPRMINAISAKIASFTAYAGQLNQWNACDFALTSEQQPNGGGCGGATAFCMCFHGGFSSGAPVGTTVDLTQTSADLNSPGDNLGKLPLALAPGKGASMFLGLDTPTPAGIYAFAVGVKVDGGGAATFAPTPSPSVLLAPVAHKWSGQGCLSHPALLSQIMATTPESYYICSES